MTRGFLARWAILYCLVALGSGFIHQVGHGIGARVDNIHISTGFATAGDAGRRPSEPDFRATLPVTGRLSTAAILGPAVNWSLGLFGALLLSIVSGPGWLASLGSALAISNAWIRALPILYTLGTFALGKPWLDDEATWAMGSNPEAGFPMSYSKLNELLATRPGLVTQNPATYFWPSLSLAFSVAVLAYAYPRSLRVLAPELGTPRRRMIFLLLPFVLGALLYPTAYFLDEHLRINW